MIQKETRGGKRVIYICMHVCAEYKKLQTNSDTQRQRYSDLLRHV